MDLQQKRMSEPEVIYEDKDLLAINKPAGLQVHAARVSERSRSSKPQEPTLVDWLLKRYPEIRTAGDDPAMRPGIVHRLDKGTSGVMLVARTQGSFEYLKSLFQAHEVRKSYLALAFGDVKPRSGVIEKPIGIKSGTLKRSVHSDKMAKEAITRYRVVGIYSLFAARYSLIEVEPKTGRTHQIRVHLASIGHPIVGDRLYGSKSSLAAGNALPSARLMLHASSIEFVAREGKRVKFEAELPEEFKEALRLLGPGAL